MMLQKFFRMGLAGALFTGALWPATARANGRFPRAQVLKAHENDLVFVGTFGMMVSADAGKSWYFVCERSMLGVPAAELETVDLFLERGTDGSIISGSNRGLRVSRDMGCTLQTDRTLPIAPAFHDGIQPNPTGFVIDVAPAKAKSPKAFVAVATLTDANKEEPQTLKHQVYESVDDARNFKALGPEISAKEAATIYTIDVAPSDANLLYMTVRPVGFGKEDQLWVSRDGAKTWPERTDIKGSREEDGSGSYIAAVHPEDPNVIFLRGQHFIPAGQVKQVHDSVSVSKDGGKTFTEILRKLAKPLGFALSPDGNTVLIGFGNHGTPGENADSDDFGIFKANVGSLQFERLTNTSTTCLLWNARGLYMCGSPVRDPFTIGFRKDADFTSETENAFTPLLVRDEAKSPLPWTGRRNDSCMDEWLGNPLYPDGVCLRFGRCPEVCKPPEIGPGPPVCQSSGGGAGGAGSAGTTGNPACTGGGAGMSTEGGAGIGAMGGNGGPAGPNVSSSCGCQVPGAPRPSSLLSAAFALFAWAQRRRRS